MTEQAYWSLEIGEVVSFAATTVVMLSSSLFFPAYYWLFILLAVVDGLATRFRREHFLVLDRIFFALFVLVLGAMAFGLAVIPMITETIAVIALIDFLFLIRRMRTRSRTDFFAILGQRGRSYLFTLVPAAVFSVGLSYFGEITIISDVGPQNAILELGLASLVVFLVIFLVTVRVSEDRRLI
jgi:hypothetical protein